MSGSNTKLNSSMECLQPKYESRPRLQNQSISQVSISLIKTRNPGLGKTLSRSPGSIATTKRVASLELGYLTVHKTKLSIQI